MLAAEPLCRLCQAPAVDVHHVTAIRHDPRRRLDAANLMPLCHACHSRITMGEGR